MAKLYRLKWRELPHVPGERHPRHAATPAGFDEPVFTVERIRLGYEEAMWGPGPWLLTEYVSEHEGYVKSGHKTLAAAKKAASRRWCPHCGREGRR